MRVNGSKQSPDKAFYACLTEKGRGAGINSTTARLVRKHSLSEYQVRLGFIPCRNALRSKSLAAVTESTEVASDLPHIDVRGHGRRAITAESEAHVTTGRRHHGRRRVRDDPAGVHRTFGLHESPPDVMPSCLLNPRERR